MGGQPGFDAGLQPAHAEAQGLRRRQPLFEQELGVAEKLIDDVPQDEILGGRRAVLGRNAFAGSSAQGWLLSALIAEAAARRTSSSGSCRKPRIASIARRL